jgi:hypothetical protein
LGAAAALTTTVWDHIITLEKEFEVVWGSPEERYLTKATFFLSRYVTEAIVIYVTYGEYLNGLCGRSRSFVCSS